MQTGLVILLFVVGLVLIIKGGDWFVDSAVFIANLTGIPKFIIGANIIDLALILPICSVVSDGKLTIAEQSYALDMPMCFAMTVIAVLPPLIKGKLYRWQGILMLALYAVYVVILVTQYGV